MLIWSSISFVVLKVYYLKDDEGYGFFEKCTSLKKKDGFVAFVKFGY